MDINYITNLQVNEFSGGWSGMNHHVHNELSKRFNVHLVQEINPPYILHEKVRSKLFRTLGMKGVYPAFSKTRLNRIASEVNSRLNTNASLNFFHGSTPWLHVSSSLPYAAYLDACFASYISVYHDKNKFSDGQLNNICQKEAAFLDKAKAVFFSSQWALDDAKRQYGLTGNNFYVAGLGEDITGLPVTAKTPGSYFLFAGLDFFGKGGDKAVRAFATVQKDFPAFTLKIIGQKPPPQFLDIPNVAYEGFIDKSAPGGMDRLQSLFENAYAFLLPTSKDMTPLVLLESAAAGCPAIASRCYGIPEMILDGETGLLIDAGPGMESELAAAMKRLCANPSLREQLGKNAMPYVQKTFSWERTGSIIANILSESN